MADVTTPAAVAPAPTSVKPAEKAKIEAPAYRDMPCIPALQPGSMKDSRPYVANEKIQEALGFHTKLDDDWQVTHDLAIARMGELLGQSRALKVFMDSCVHCGATSLCPARFSPAWLAPGT